MGESQVKEMRLQMFQVAIEMVERTHSGRLFQREGAQE